MTILKMTLSISALIIITLGCSQEQFVQDEDEFAPPDAYIGDSKHAYYGSLNPWDRRFFSEQSAERLYGRWGQRYILDILEGRAENAIQASERKLQEDPLDLEAGFVLTAAYSSMDMPEEAFNHMIDAIKSGLPFSRFLAGPRQLLTPLYESAQFKEYYNSNPVLLIHGPMVGSVTESSAQFWIRTWEEVQFQIELTSGDSEAVVRSLVYQTDSKKGYTGIGRVSGLKPQTIYFYNVLVDGKPYYEYRKRPFFSTFPLRNESLLFRVAFGGGAGYASQNERMWELLSSYNLSALLLLGDNVYIDAPGKPGEFHDYTYFRRQSRPEFRKLVSSVPVYAIWDDHDIAIDDIWMGPYVDKPDWKLDNLEYFKNQWVNPYYGDEEYPATYFDFSIGDVDFFLLDGRNYRTNPFEKNPTMLGPIQKQWLFEKLRNSTAKFKVVASPVGWAPGIKPGSKDTWDGFPDEREEIFSFIEENKIEGIVLLSADRHRSDAWKIERENGYPLYDFMSSKLTNIHTHDIEPGSLFSYNDSCSFGLLEFDLTKDEPELAYTIVSIDDEQVYTITIKRGELEF
jgi:alkaline phosphatase D